MEIDPWQDLQDIQNQERQPAPELSDPVIPDQPMLFALSGGGNWTISADSPVLWVPITENGYGGDFTWSDTETFEPGAEFVNLDYLASIEQKVGAIYSNGALTVSVKTYNQTFTAGKFSLTGSVFGAFGFRLGTQYVTSSDVLYVYPESVTLDIIDRMSTRYTLGTWELSNGNVDLNDVIEIPSDVSQFVYKFNFPEYSNEFRFNTTGSNLYLSFYLEDGADLEPYDEQTGILNSIIQWLQAILDALINLPGNIAGMILDGLQGLFVPSEEDILELKDKYDALLQERLGFVYEAFSWVVQSASDVLRMIQDGGEYEFVFPGVSFPMNGETITIVEETPVSLDNELMDVIRPVLGTIVSFVCVLSFMQSSFYMVTAMISGASYFEWLKGQKGGGSS